MASLDGVVAEWDASEEVRTRLRLHGQLIIALPSHDPKQIKVDVATGEYNFEALRPLAKRLQFPVGDVGMHGVPFLEHENLGLYGLCCVLFSFSTCLILIQVLPLSRS